MESGVTRRQTGAMESLFDGQGRAAMLARVERLQADAARRWGKMDAAQMLAHAQVGLRVAQGDLRLKRALIGVLFGGLARRSLLKPAPFGKNLPTAAEFRVTDARDFAREKAALLALARRFGENGSAGLTREPHPFFGRLTPEQWDRLQWKHLDHHLRQFGA